MRTLLQIGEIAQLLAVTAKTIRHYQKIGLLAEPERTEAGYRLYNAYDLLRLQRIRRLQALGLSLKQIKAVLGGPEHERTLRDVLQALDQEIAIQIQALQERRKKIRALLDEDRLDAFDELPTDSPSVQYLKEHLGAYFSNIDPAFLKQETQLQALLDNFHWTEDHQEKMQQLNQRYVQHVGEHPEEYQQLLALGERLAALASLSEDAPEVGQLVEDMVQYFESYPFLLELQMQFPQLKSPFTGILSDLLNPILSPTQKRFAEELSRRMSSINPS